MRDIEDIIIINDQKISSIDFKALFDEIMNCRVKKDLINTFARYGIRDHTHLKEETSRTNSKGMSTDLYASFRTPDNKNNSSHIYFEATLIRIDINEKIANDRYFSNFDICKHTSDGKYRNKCFIIAYDIDEFKYVMSYFLRYSINWLDREKREIEPVKKIEINKGNIKKRDKRIQKNIKQIINIIDKDIEKSLVCSLDKQVLTKMRINQSVFRDSLINRYSHCCLCDINNEDLLIASHIKPWAKSSDNEKLDVNNGLLLCPNHDKLFDKGYISFDNDGNILISEKLSDENLRAMNITKHEHIYLTYENKEYMEYHRKVIFKSIRK